MSAAAVQGKKLEGIQTRQFTPKLGSAKKIVESVVRTLTRRIAQKSSEKTMQHIDSTAAAANDATFTLPPNKPTAMVWRVAA